MGQNGDEPTIGQLVANASKDLSGLVRGEIELAKTELKKTAVEGRDRRRHVRGGRLPGRCW